MNIDEVAAKWLANEPKFRGWLPAQQAALQAWELNTADRILVHYPTGKGKTTIMLSMIAQRDITEVTVMAPPITHPKWIADGLKLGIEVTPISHATFRGKGYKVDRKRAMIVDEFHLLGGHTGVGWKKLDKVSAGLQAPLILGSATPNYNDAERCYCLVHVLSPHQNAGGFKAWLYDHCVTENNPYGSLPLVLGFKNYATAAEFLAAQPNVVYLPDDAPDILQVRVMNIPLPDEFETLGLDRMRERVIASDMEDRQRRRFMSIVGPDGRLREEVLEDLSYLLGNYGSPILVFCVHKEIAKIVQQTFESADLNCGYIDGDTAPAVKDRQLELFITGQLDYLIGTASLATGPDGMDKVCDVLVILDDTDDDAMRRQLVGRILPRGEVQPEDYIGKVAYQYRYENS